MDVLTRHNVRVTGPESGGTGHVVLLAHGFGCDQHMWRLIGPDLRRGHAVVLFDHAGAGRPTCRRTTRSGTRPWTATPTTCSRSAGSSTCGDVVFVGHSVSAMIGVLAAIASRNGSPRWS